jgi:formylglycine-generating enzyme required for sulfatase activity
MGQYDYAMPIHTVHLTEDFWMDNTEVTQKDYSDLMLKTYGTIAVDEGWYSDGFCENNNYPAYGILWLDAILYCNARTRESGVLIQYTVILH